MKSRNFIKLEAASTFRFGEAVFVENRFTAMQNVAVDNERKHQRSY
jgi:hypothetical protein